MSEKTFWERTTTFPDGKSYTESGVSEPGKINLDINPKESYMVSADNGTTVRLPRYECAIHGNIGNTTMMIIFYVKDQPFVVDYQHNYCMKCYDEFLQQNVSMVREAG